jgi:hypothetical protein
LLRWRGKPLTGKKQPRPLKNSVRPLKREGVMKMDMIRRMLYIPIFHIDTNMINAYGHLSAMRKLEKWAADEVILINMSNVSFSEAQQGKNAKRTKNVSSGVKMS